jgi:hypothetical protein
VDEKPLTSCAAHLPENRLLYARLVWHLVSKLRLGTSWSKLRFDQDDVIVCAPDTSSAASKQELRSGGFQAELGIRKTQDDFESHFICEAHFDYIHYDPVEHKHVRCPGDWPWPSLHRRVAVEKVQSGRK